MMELTEATQKTLDFMTELAGQALEEGNKGDTTLANRLSRQSPAFAYWFINISTRSVMTPEQFARQMPHLLKEAERLRLDYERALTVDQANERLTKIEEALAALPNLLQEQVKKAFAESAPAKRGGKKNAEVETTEEEAE